MFKRCLVLLTTATGLLVSPLSASELDRESMMRTAQALFQPLPEVVDNPDNPLNDPKIELGKMLYYNPRLSKSGFNWRHGTANQSLNHHTSSLTSKHKKARLITEPGKLWRLL